MKQGLTEIICVIDKSGSMEPTKNDSIGGFNNFLKQQKELPGDAILTLTLFDTDYATLYNGTPIKDAAGLTNVNYSPSGHTAMYDAICHTIDIVGERLSKTDEANKPEKVMFVILTDGEENSSKEYNKEQTLSKIKQQTDVYKWEFVFLAANQDAIANAKKLNISAANTVAFASTGDGTRSAYLSMNNIAKSYRAKK